LLYILFGEDDFSLTKSLEEIKQGLGDQSLLMANTTVLDGQQVTLDQLRAVVETAPFLAEKRLAIIEGLLGRFEAGGKQSISPLLTALPEFPRARFWFWWTAR
jgi:DNA polymerase III delta subunit